MYTSYLRSLLNYHFTPLVGAGLMTSSKSTKYDQVNSSVERSLAALAKKAVI
jgi:hypothetical protein